MKPEIPYKNGDFYDAFTGWRKYLYWRPGKIKKIQRAYWKRVRRYIKNKLKTIT